MIRTLPNSAARLVSGITKQRPTKYAPNKTTGPYSWQHPRVTTPPYFFLRWLDSYRSDAHSEQELWYHSPPNVWKNKSKKWEKDDPDFPLVWKSSTAAGRHSKKHPTTSVFGGTVPPLGVLNFSTKMQVRRYAGGGSKSHSGGPPLTPQEYTKVKNKLKDTPFYSKYDHWPEWKREYYRWFPETYTQSFEYYLTHEEGRHHFAIRCSLGVAGAVLLGIAFSPFYSPAILHWVPDLPLAFFVPFHTYFGTKSVVVDYIPRSMHNTCLNLLFLLCVLAAWGWLNALWNGGGIYTQVRYLWMKTPPPPEETEKKKKKKKKSKKRQPKKEEHH